MANGETRAVLPSDAKVVEKKPDGPQEAHTEFFVRVGNATKARSPVERGMCILAHWRAQHFNSSSSEIGSSGWSPHPVGVIS